MNTLGFIYVNISTFNCKRKSYLFSNHESRSDFFMTLLGSPIFFFFGNNIALRAENDISKDGFSEWDCIWYNFGLWTVGYVLGLEFTYMDGGIMKGFVLNPAYIRLWSKKMWMIASLILFVTLGMLGYIFYIWYTVDLLWFPFAVLGLWAIFFVSGTLITKNTHDFHLHHYNVGMIFVTLLGV